MVDCFGPETTLEPKILVKRRSLPLISLRHGKEVDPAALLALINEGIDISKDIYLQYLDHTVSKMAEDFRELLFLRDDNSEENSKK